MVIPCLFVENLLDRYEMVTHSLYKSDTTQFFYVNGKLALHSFVQLHCIYSRAYMLRHHHMLNHAYYIKC
uniref:Uncharacterized protein n=1 Tax=Babesia bovis TaxID=5865 RepID=S6BNB8_BABBO|nr:hypothetical protein [Babesia bovis]